jgi:UDP-4-amino-4,6-dideoxy-N-acetyl-beta-L-altrosamine transaminase
VIPYSTQDISQDDLRAVTDVLQSGWLTQGPAVPRFEKDFAAAHQVTHAIAVSNATAALHIACIALGVKAGSRVWTSPISFVASANCALYCGAAVDFVDIDPVSRNMSTEALERKLIAARRTSTLPDVVIPVDFAGEPCELARIRELADEYGFAILEDASHAVGASYRGAMIGSRYADIAVFSFHAVKIITTAEGGLIATSSEHLAHRLRLLRSHGITRDPALMNERSQGAWYYEQIELGFNYRMTDMQAALGSSQLKRLRALHARRIELADRYERLLAGLPLLTRKICSDRVSALHLYVVEIDEQLCSIDRALVFERLRAAGIGVNVHYIPIHLQPFYRNLGFAPGAFPAAEKFYSRALTLPLFPALSDRQQEEVVAALSDALRH